MHHAHVRREKHQIQEQAKTDPGGARDRLDKLKDDVLDYAATHKNRGNLAAVIKAVRE